MTDNFNEQDLVKLFTNKKPKLASIDVVLNILSKIMLFIMLIIGTYLVINFNAFKDKLVFWYQYDFKASQVIDEIIIPDPTIEIADKEKPGTGINIEMPDNSILIPTLSLHAPVAWRVNNVAKDVHNGLTKGVIQINGTALPGEKGNIYITGHSSNYIWSTGDYNSIFSVINRLVAGDYIYLKFNGQIFAYKVFDQKVVSSKDLSILGKTNDSRLTLATCWPLGTSLKRLVVLANQTYPSPNKNKAASFQADFKQLPGQR